MKRASALLGWLAVALLVLIVGEFEVREAPRPLGVELPARHPTCARLGPMAGRVDLVVIDHVLVYLCVHP